MRLSPRRQRVPQNHERGKMFIRDKRYDNGYRYKDAGWRLHGGGDRKTGSRIRHTSGAPTVADVQRKLEARGVTPKAMKTILEDLGEVIIPLS